MEARCSGSYCGLGRVFTRAKYRSVDTTSPSTYLPTTSTDVRIGKAAPRPRGKTLMSSATVRKLHINTSFECTKITKCTICIIHNTMADQIMAFIKQSIVAEH